MSGEPVWHPISTAPRDGTWFVTARFPLIPDQRPEYEIGAYDPLMFDRFVEAGNGLYRKEQESGYDWVGFNNFLRATHWMGLPPPPERTPSSALAERGA